MLASYLHNFIFIKTQKTGSTTVESVFADFCGPDDVITPLGHKDEMRRNNGKPLCRNFESSKELEDKWIASLIEGNRLYRREGARESMKFYSHMGAGEIKSKLDATFWANAFKFTIERHPYEKVVSAAFYKLGLKRPTEEFPKMLKKILRKQSYATFRYYSIDNQVIVDDIVKLENLRPDLERVAKKIGVTLPDELPRMKSHVRQDERPAREILTQSQKDEVYHVCKQEFDLLGYER
jgi:hypothetical protein